MRAIYFDMDGTLVDFYGVKNWLNALHNESVMPYVNAKPFITTELINIINQFKAKGIIVGIISWSAMNGSKEFNRRVRDAKLKWINTYFPNCFDEFHVVKYGTPKHRVANIKDSIIVDDDSRVRDSWKNGIAIDASNCEEMMETLYKLAA